MTELENCMLLHIHKAITDELDIREIAKEFTCANMNRQRYFGNFDIALQSTRVTLLFILTQCLVCNNTYVVKINILL